MSGSASYPIDPTVPLQAGKGLQQQGDPFQRGLQQAGSILDIQNKANQLKLFPYQERQQAAIAGQEEAKNIGAQRSLGYAFLAPLMDLPPEQWTHQAVTDAIARAGAVGVDTRALVKEFTAAPQADGATLASYMRPIIGTGMMASGPERAAALGQPTSIDQGLGVQPGVTGGVASSRFGQFQPAGSQIPVYPSRATQIQRVPGPPDSRGAPTTVPLGAVSPSSLTGMPDMGTGRPDNVPPALRNPNAPQQGSQSALPGQITTGLSPSESAEQTARAGSSNQAFNEISAAGTKARDQSALLSNMLNDMARFTTGTGAQATLDFKRFMQAYASPIASILGIKPEEVAAQESFDKIANQLADAYGAGSNMKLQVNQGANPHSSLSPSGASFIIRQLQGLADYAQARQRLAAAYPDQTDVRGFEAKIGSQLDPRYFQFNRLTPEQKTEYYKAIPDKERSKFKTGYLNAQQAGLMAVP